MCVPYCFASLLSFPERFPHCERAAKNEENRQQTDQDASSSRSLPPVLIQPRSYISVQNPFARSNELRRRNRPAQPPSVRTTAIRVNHAQSMGCERRMSDVLPHVNHVKLSTLCEKKTILPPERQCDALKSNDTMMSAERTHPEAQIAETIFLCVEFGG